MRGAGSYIPLLIVAAGVAGSARPAGAATAVLAPVKDNTLYETSDGSLSNGAGQHLFAGNNGLGETRRGLIAFDIAGGIPPGATITGASLTLSMSRTRAGPEPVSLHRVLADWGEGTSVAGRGEGIGAPSTPGDATWIHRFFSELRWAAAGGDFDPTPSATIMVGGIGLYTWISTPALVADVQLWLDAPGMNSGWILIGNELGSATAKRFDSRENISAASRPMLSVEFTSGATSAGRVPNGADAPGQPLTAQLEPASGSLRLSWGRSCLPGDTDFEIYEGRIGEFTGHVPIACSTGGATSAAITPAPGDRYYLIVPRNPSREGSYGVDSRGADRGASPDACLPQSVAACP
ncbi:MAG: DNRLRE domain-containing protein [Acidobacteriota bacterium]